MHSHVEFAGVVIDQANYTHAQAWVGLNFAQDHRTGITGAYYQHVHWLTSANVVAV
jgi:hypothetical protein